MAVQDRPRDPDEQLGELRRQLLRYRADRYPAEHATLQFHLGTTLLHLGRGDQATAALRTASDLFRDNDRPVERAKALNMLGVALREVDDRGDARQAFADAAELFHEHDHRLEEGAARFNRGLLHLADGDHDGARRCFLRARDLLHDGPPAQRAAVARELGGLHLTMDDPQAAVTVLEEAIELASRAGDRAGMGAAANTLGLAHLAADRPEEAVEELRTALAAHPRRLRPEAHAMARVNLALAYERLGDGPHARLAARQAAAVPASPRAVVAQAHEILERLEPRDDDLLRVIDGIDDEEARIAEVRHEVARWLDIPADEREDAVRAWVAGQVAREDAAVELAATLLNVVLELPPDGFATMVASIIRALRLVDAEVRARFRTHVSRAMARFNVPQWMRLKDTFNRLADELGDDGNWG